MSASPTRIPTTSGPVEPSPVESGRFEPSPDQILPPLTPRAELACLARALYREGYEEHIAGHISYKQPDGTLLVNPFHLRWDEVRGGAHLPYRPRRQRARR